MRKYLVRNVLFPLIDRFTSQDFYEKYRFYVGQEYRDFGERRKYQWERFKEILEHAYENVPLYREKFDAAGITPDDIESRQDLSKIPITTKNELREGFPDKVMAENIDHGEIRYTNTSGTTGRVTMLAQDRGDINYKYAAKLRSRKLYGNDIAGSVLRFTPNECQPADIENQGMEDYMDLMCNSFKNPINTMYGFYERTAELIVGNKKKIGPLWEDSTDIPEGEVEQVIESISDSKKDILVAYPLYLQWLLEHRNPGDNGFSIPGTVDLTAGLATERMVSKFESIFETDVNQCYGGCEFGRFASTCEHSSNWMHILEEHCLVEFVGPDGRPVSEDEPANIISTSLTNYAMPIIRLEHGDVGRYRRSNCECGRTGRMMKVEGRIQSIIYDEDDKFHLPSKMYDYFNGRGDVRFFKAVQSDESKVEIRIVSSEMPDTGEMGEELSEMYPGLEFDIAEVESIESESSNKYMLVESCTYDRFRLDEVASKKAEIN